MFLDYFNGIIQRYSLVFYRWNVLTHFTGGQKCHPWVTRMLLKWRSPTDPHGLKSSRRLPDSLCSGCYSSHTSERAACTQWSLHPTLNSYSHTIWVTSWTSDTLLRCCSYRLYCSVTCLISSTWRPYLWWPTCWWPPAWASHFTIHCVTYPAFLKDRLWGHLKRSQRFSVSPYLPWKPLEWYVMNYWSKSASNCMGKNRYLQKRFVGMTVYLLISIET